VRDLPQIRALYLEIDTEFRRLRTNAISIHDLNRAQQIELKQIINDQAYFLLCWGQLETAIDEKCRDAIRSRRKSSNWAIRRGWDLYNPDDPRLSGLRFEHRTALVLDRSGGKGSPWAKVMEYYAMRNQIAHGELLARRIDLAEVVQDLFKIQAALQA